jgi:hypothetical protein
LPLSVILKEDSESEKRRKSEVLTIHVQTVVCERRQIIRRLRETSQVRWPARSLGSMQRRLDDQAMERRNSRDIRPPPQMIEGHDRCDDESAAQSGLFNQNGQTEVEMAIVLAKNNLMTTPIVDPKEIDPVGRNVIAQLRRCLKTKPRNQSVP